MFPPVYTGAIMSGQGLAGLVVSLSSILTTASAPTSVDYCDDAVVEDNCSSKISYSALAYFTLATLILLSCIVAFILLRHLPFAR
jgi:equilibrative nucleoside transporter 1/2/3